MPRKPWSCCLEEHPKIVDAMAVLSLLTGPTAVSAERLPSWLTGSHHRQGLSKEGAAPKSAKECWQGRPSCLVHARKASQPEWLCLDGGMAHCSWATDHKLFIPRLVDEPLSHDHKAVLLI